MHSAFNYLTVGKSELYRRVMLAFVAAKRRFTVHLRPEDVHAALGGTPDLAAVADALVALEGWGNLRADPDTSRVTTVEDFHRARFLYQLTPEGEAAEEALAVYDEALGRRGALQAVALTDIATQLRALLELASAPDPDPAKVHLSLRALVDRFTDLADNAQAFMGSLQRDDRPARRRRRRVPRLQGPADRLPGAVHHGPGRHRCGDRRADRAHRGEPGWSGCSRPPRAGKRPTPRPARSADGDDPT